MGRYRPPAPPSSLYITQPGYLALKEEEKLIWKRRAVTTRALSAAAAEGDRSENAEYIYRKKELRELDRRIRYLQKRLPELKVISDPPSSIDQVFFGAWVTLEDEQGKTVTYRIVGPDELDPGKGWISMDSPMSKALMSKFIDDEVSVKTPSGEAIYLVTGIEYRSLENH